MGNGASVISKLAGTVSDAEPIYMQVSLDGEVKWEDMVDVPLGVDPASFAQNLANVAMEGLKAETNVDTGLLQSSWQVLDADSGHILIENDTAYAIYVNDGNDPREGASVATIPEGFHYVERAMDSIDDYISQAEANAEKVDESADEAAQDETSALFNPDNRYIDTGESFDDVQSKSNDVLARLLARFRSR